MVHAEDFDFAAEVQALARSLRAPRQPREYRRVLLAYDGSPDARAAAEKIATVTSPNTTVTIITVVPYESVGSKLDPIAPELRDWQRTALLEASALLVNEHLEPFIEASFGNPVTAIIETARALDADLVVIGRGKRHQVYKRQLANQLLRRLDCDVLVVSRERTRPPH